MNKAELVAAIAEKAEISKKDAEKALNAATQIVVNEVAEGNDVQLVGFGTFTKVERAERTGKNPQTGESINIPAAVVPKFKAGKAFKDAVNA